MKTINTKCDSCKAEPGQGCRNVGIGDEVMTPSGFHIGRVRTARRITGIEHSERAAIKAASRG